MEQAIAPLDFWSEIQNSVAVTIDGKRALIPKRRAVALADLFIEDGRDENGQPLVRLTANIDGHEHGLEVPYATGHRNEAIEAGRQSIEGSVNLTLHEAEGRKGEWKPSKAAEPLPETGPHPLNDYKQAAIHTARALSLAEIADKRRAEERDADRLVDFADSLASYLSVKSAAAMGVAIPDSVPFAERKMRAAYDALLDDVAKHVAGRLIVVAE